MRKNSMIKKLRMFANKAGNISTSMINNAILGIVLLVVLFKLYATLVPEAQTAGDELNASGVPLGNLFTSNGIIFLVIMVALIIVVVRSFLKTGSGKGKK